MHMNISLIFRRLQFLKLGGNKHGVVMPFSLLKIRFEVISDPNLSREDQLL